MKKSPENQIESINQRIKGLAGIYRSAISKLGISENKFWVWYTLINSKVGCTQQEICGRWSLPKQTVNTIIKNMVEKKQVLLKAIPGKRKQKIIHLTDEGKKYGENIIKPIVEAEQKAFLKLFSDDINICEAVLEKYMNFLSMEFFDNSTITEIR